MKAMHSISVIMPSLNVVQYVQESIESVVNQSMNEIEIICVDAGSTDGTLELLQEYAEKDKRITVIVSDKKSYGYQMNLGIRAARGEYVGIVETDDYIMPEMYEKLYAVAKKTQADIVKADYYELYGDDKIANSITQRNQYDKILNPKEEAWLYYIPMMNPLGIFKTSYIRDNNISFNETPGAAQQDLGFWLQSLCFAEKFVLTKGNFYVYRKDNMASSMHQTNKMSPVIDEYLFAFDKIKENEALLESVKAVYYHRLFGSSIYAYNNLNPEIKTMFLMKFAITMIDAQASGDLDTSRFSETEEAELHEIMHTPMTFLRKSTSFVSFPPLEKKGAWTKDVTVIIPVYNTEKYLVQCLDSIKYQTISNFEVICIDDGSTDECLQIMKSYEAADSRFKIIRQPSMRQGVARNNGLRYAKGKYVFFMDSDDFLLPNAFELLIAKAEKDDLDVLLFDANSIYESEALAKQFSEFSETYHRKKEYGEVFFGPDLFATMRKNDDYRVVPWLQLISHDHIINNNIQFPCWAPYEDNVFTMKIILSSNRASHIQQSLCIRRVREASTMTSVLNFDNFYGYYACYLSMINFLYNKNYSEPVWNEIRAELKIIFRNVRNSSRALVNRNSFFKSKMSIYERTVFETLFITFSDPSNTENKELALVRESWSYRLGRMLTWLPRKLRGVVRCIQEHGLKYTIKVYCKME